MSGDQSRNPTQNRLPSDSLQDLEVSGALRRRMKWLGRRFLSRSTRRKILRWTRRPPVGEVDFGQLRRLKPISRSWGGDRGRPVDRYYIEGFLATCAEDIKGRVLEVGDNAYTLGFGGDRVTRSDILNAPPGTPESTFVADFTNAPILPSDAFDCVICTQTLQLIPAVAAAVDTLHRILIPGGVLLVTVPGISPIYRDELNRWQDHWRFTTASTKWLLDRHFDADALTVKAYGNVLSAVAFLHGFAAEELSADELDHVDPFYELLIAARAVKSSQAADPKE